MNDPRDSMKHLAEQMGWVGEMLGPEFWNHFQQATGNAKTSPPRAGASQPPGRPVRPGAFPPIDIYTNPNEVVVSAALPGLVSHEHVSVCLAGPKEVVLEAFIQPDGPLGMVLHRERFSGYFTRTFTLPVAVRPDGTAARYADGVLELRFAKAESGGPGGVALLQVQQAPATQ